MKKLVVLKLDGNFHQGFRVSVEIGEDGSLANLERTYSDNELRLPPIPTLPEISLVAVIGASGSGKSSVVFAGLIPQLKQDKKHDWLIASFRPGNNPLQSLAIALTSLDFTQAIQNNPQYAEAYYQQGLIYAQYAQGKPLNPDGTALGCKKKENYIIICPFEFKDRIKENKQKAIKDFTQAIQINPQYAAAYHQRGLVEDEHSSTHSHSDRSERSAFMRSQIW